MKMTSLSKTSQRYTKFLKPRSRQTCIAYGSNSKKKWSKTMKLNENFDQLIKKEKRKRLLKTIAISFVTTVVLLFIGFTLINKRMEMQYKKAQEMANITDMIESPNLVSQSQYLSTSGRVTSQLKSERSEER